MKSVVENLTDRRKEQPQQRHNQQPSQKPDYFIIIFLLIYIFYYGLDMHGQKYQLNKASWNWSPTNS
jgi:membrane-anchored glycerophosphoryl diester phosphodiesterase (GDPDase)